MMRRVSIADPAVRLEKHATKSASRACPTLSPSITIVTSASFRPRFGSK